MKNVKKIALGLGALVIGASLASCGGNETPTSNPTSGGQATNSSPALTDKNIVCPLLLSITHPPFAIIILAFLVKCFNSFLKTFNV